MKNHELLVPAGNMECLRQAVFHGCDAVYLGCQMFGARKFANNFTNEEVVDAIRFCHLYGVKVYVTMNTLIKNDEVSSFLEQARFLHEKGVDALIVQDFGMICLLREMFPNLEIHASTQANISSQEVCELYYQLGVKRVVFSRELSIDEIDRVNVPIEKEAFIHGALCISYSGCCLMSSMLGGRSGNRGECAGVCRMPFSLLKDGTIVSEEKYLLSTKELNTSSQTERLLKSSIYSFKIEGRMKSPLYVGFITNFYRKLIDGENIHYSEELDKLRTIFNREFTVGRMFGASDKDLMNHDSPNHVGLKVGKVVGISKKRIQLKLFDGYSLHQHDAIRFLNSKEGFVVNYLYDRNNRLVSSSSSDGICFVDRRSSVKIGDIVLKTQDFLLEKEYQEDVSRKIPISYKVVALLQQPLQISITDGTHTFSSKGEVVSLAIHAPVTDELIERPLKKLGNSPFLCTECLIERDDSIFISVKELNEIRRDLVSQLMAARENSKNVFLEKKVLFDSKKVSLKDSSKKGHKVCSVRTKEQLDACLTLGFDRIYVMDRELYHSYKKFPNVFFYVPRCCFSVFENLEERNLVSDYADYQNTNSIGNYALNVTNIYTAYYLQKLGLSSLCLSPELSEVEIDCFFTSYWKTFGHSIFEVLVYGRVEDMIIKGNILNLNKSEFDYLLIDSKKRKFPVYYDGNLTHILNWEKKNIWNDSFLEKCVLRFDFFEEDEKMIYEIVKKYQ